MKPDKNPFDYIILDMGLCVAVYSNHEAAALYLLECIEPLSPSKLEVLGRGALLIDVFKGAALNSLDRFVEQFIPLLCSRQSEGPKKFNLFRERLLSTAFRDCPTQALFKKVITSELFSDTEAPIKTWLLGCFNEDEAGVAKGTLGDLIPGFIVYAVIEGALGRGSLRLLKILAQNRTLRTYLTTQKSALVAKAQNASHLEIVQFLNEL